jgi:hypothetical protein
MAPRSLRRPAARRPSPTSQQAAFQTTCSFRAAASSSRLAVARCDAPRPAVAGPSRASMFAAVERVSGTEASLKETPPPRRPRAKRAKPTQTADARAVTLGIWRTPCPHARLLSLLMDARRAIRLDATPRSRRRPGAVARARVSPLRRMWNIAPARILSSSQCGARSSITLTFLRNSRALRAVRRPCSTTLGRLASTRLVK